MADGLLARLAVAVTANTAGFSKNLAKAKADLGGFEKSVGMAKSALAAFGIGLGAVEAVSFVKDSVAAFEEAFHQQQKLAAVLKATGYAAGFSKEQLNEYASALQATTNYDDDAVAGAQAVLATFRDIKGLQFTQATDAVLDLSTVMDQDLKSSAVQIGKALNDPIRGITALRRVGVSFTEDQIQMVKAMVKANDVIGAQSIVLAELNQEFGGAAHEVRSELTGLSNDWGDLKEAIGGVFHTEAANKFFSETSSGIRDLTGHVGDLSKMIDKVMAANDALATGISEDERISKTFKFARLEFGDVPGVGAALDLAESVLSPERTAKAQAAAKADEQAKADDDLTKSKLKISAAIFKETEALELEIATLGKSAEAKKLAALEAKAEAEGVKDAVAGDLERYQALVQEKEAEQALASALKEINDARERANDAADKEISDLSRAASLHGKVGAALEDEKLRLAGVTEERRRLLGVLRSERNERERQEKFDKAQTEKAGAHQHDLTSRFEEFQRQTRTPQEELDAKLREIDELRNADYGTTKSGKETLDRAEAAARKEFEGQTPGGHKPEGNQALLANTSEAYSAIFRAPHDGVASQQLKEQQKQTKTLGVIANKLGDGGLVVMVGKGAP